MKYYLSVKFVKTNKIYYFATDDETIKNGDFVVVETIIGKEMGTVVKEPEPLENLKFNLEIKPILRRAKLEDIKQFNQSQKDAIKASKIFEKNKDTLKLNMNLISSQYTLDKQKILFTYVSDDRVDFRELLKILANELHCRIELKQISPREKAQSIGGIGTCGLKICCSTFLKDIEGVTLNKAKNQLLSINIPKLSGQCGKLMCCLNFEDSLYTEEKKKFPTIGTKIKMNSQEYKVSSFNILSKIIRLESEDTVEYISLDEYNNLTKKHG